MSDEKVIKDWHKDDQVMTARCFDLEVGDVLIDRDGYELLVGDVNALGGVCDDCIYPTEIVELRRGGRVVWRKS